MMVEREHDRDDSDEPSLESARPVPIWAQVSAWLSLLLTVIAVINFFTLWGPQDGNLNKEQQRRENEAFTAMLQKSLLISVVAFGLSFVSVFGVRSRKARRRLLPVSLFGILLSALVGVCALVLLMLTGIRV